LPALEAFGLTILEAMISGLPTSPLNFMAPQKLSKMEKMGHINPTNLEETALKILNFINQCDNNSQYWQEISERAIKRVRDKYNWQLHTNDLLLCAKIQGF